VSAPPIPDRTGPRRSPGAILSWCLYDFANSAYPTVVTTFVFAAYYTQAIADTPEAGTAQWGLASGLAAAAVAVLSPVLGAIADRSGRLKPWLGLFTVLCIATTALLWFARPGPESAILALVLVALASAAFEYGMVFYNSLMAVVAPPDRLGRVSGWGWGLGYAGGLGCLVVALIVFVQAETPPFGLDKAAAEHVRATAPLVAVWFGLFALPLFLFVPDRPATGIAIGRAAREGVMTLVATLRRIRDHGTIARFLVARMLYADGLTTLFAFGGIYAAGTFGMSLEEVIQFGITLNVTAGLGAAAFAWLDDRLGPKPVIVTALIALIALGAGTLLVTDKGWFWALGLGLGIFVGPAQAASRSLMSRLAPDELETEMFGLYALSGKATAFLGPMLLAAATAAFDSQRAGMATILLFFLSGLALLLTVRVSGGSGGGR